jgi:hypothetical protein
VSRLLNPVFGNKENLDFPFSLVSKIGQPQFTQPPMCPRAVSPRDLLAERANQRERERNRPC